MLHSQWRSCRYPDVIWSQGFSRRANLHSGSSTVMVDNCTWFEHATNRYVLTFEMLIINHGFYLMTLDFIDLLPLVTKIHAYIFPSACSHSCMHPENLCQMNTFFTLFESFWTLSPTDIFSIEYVKICWDLSSFFVVFFKVLLEGVQEALCYPYCCVECEESAKCLWFNSLTPEICSSNFTSVFFKLFLQIDILDISCEIALRWMLQDPTVLIIKYWFR